MIKSLREKCEFFDNKERMHFIQKFFITGDIMYDDSQQNKRILVHLFWQNELYSICSTGCLNKFSDNLLGYIEILLGEYIYLDIFVDSSEFLTKR